MRVLQIGASYVGAQRKIEKAIHEFLCYHGDESYVLFSIGESENDNIFCYENVFYRLIRRVLGKLFGKNNKTAFLSTIRIINFIRKINPDIINLHILHHGYIDYVLLLNYLAKKKIPVVFTAHDMWHFTGGCYYYTTIGCKKFLNGCQDCPKEKKELDCSPQWTSLNFKRKMKLYDKLDNLSFVSVSPWVHIEMMKSFLSQYPQYMIMNSVDAQECEIFNNTKNERFTIIGVAANWDDRKGIDRFLRLADMLQDYCDFVLVGNVDAEHKMKATKNITFTGAVNDLKTLYHLYSSCDLHVSLSYEETFGLTFVEAAIAGIKSLGFNSTAIPYVLEKTYGYVIDSFDILDVADKIRELSLNRKSCVLSKDEISLIKETFSTRAMAEQYYKVFQDTISRRERR